MKLLKMVKIMGDSYIVGNSKEKMFIIFGGEAFLIKKPFLKSFGLSCFNNNTLDFELSFVCGEAKKIDMAEVDKTISISKDKSINDLLDIINEKLEER